MGVHIAQSKINESNKLMKGMGVYTAQNKTKAMELLKMKQMGVNIEQTKSSTIMLQ